MNTNIDIEFSVHRAITFIRYAQSQHIYKGQ